MTMTKLDDVSGPSLDIHVPTSRLLRAVDRLHTLATWGAIAALAAVLGSYAACERPARPHYEVIGPDPETLPLPPPLAAPDAGEAVAWRDIDAGALLMAAR